MPTFPNGQLLAEAVNFQGHSGDWISGYLARPLWRQDLPAVVVLHHRNGLDAETEEITRNFAAHGYLALCPNLHHREERNASITEAAEALITAGGVPDDRCLGDVTGAVTYLRNLPTANGKLGVIGYCAGGRQAYLVACQLPLDAAVVCYGGNIVAGPDKLTERKPVAPVDMTATLSCPLLSLSGRNDTHPSPAEIAIMGQALEAHGKLHEIHIYEDTGHAFFAVERPSYQPVSATDGWHRVFDWFGKFLG